MNDLTTVTTYRAILGAVIANLRATKGIKQSALAEAVGIGPSTWSRIEKGESALTTDQLRLAAKALGEQPSRILELAESAEKEVEGKGVRIETEGRPDWVAGAAGLTAAYGSGLLPLVGPVLVGLVGVAVSAALLNRNGKEKKDKPDEP